MSLNPLQYFNVEAVWQGTVAFLPRFMAGILVFAAFYVLYKATVLILRTALERRKTHASIISLTVKTYKYILVLAGLVLALNQMGIDVAAALAGLGIVGVAIGFSGRDTVSNYIAGITIFWDKPFVVGDYISVSDEYGRVTEITMRSTRIRTLQNMYLIVPNVDIVNSLVINHSKNGEVRVEVPINISYADDIEHTRKVLLHIVDSEHDSRLSRYLRASVVVDRLGDNGVQLLLRLWINKAEDEKDVLYEYAEFAKYALDRAHITIPFPQRVLHVRED